MRLDSFMSRVKFSLYFLPPESSHPSQVCCLHEKRAFLTRLLAKFLIHSLAWDGRVELEHSHVFEGQQRGWRTDCHQFPANRNFDVCVKLLYDIRAHEKICNRRLIPSFHGWPLSKVDQSNSTTIVKGELMKTIKCVLHNFFFILIFLLFWILIAESRSENYCEFKFHPQRARESQKSQLKLNVHCSRTFMFIFSHFPFIISLMTWCCAVAWVREIIKRTCKQAK